MFGELALKFEIRSIGHRTQHRPGAAVLQALIRDEDLTPVNRLAGGVPHMDEAAVGGGATESVIFALMNIFMSFIELDKNLRLYGRRRKPRSKAHARGPRILVLSSR